MFRQFRRRFASCLFQGDMSRSGRWIRIGPLCAAKEILCAGRPPFDLSLFKNWYTEARPVIAVVLWEQAGHRPPHAGQSRPSDRDVHIHNMKYMS